jgi:hypothetical protein
MHPSMCFIGTFPEVGGLVVGGWVSDFEKRAGEVGSPVAGTALMPGTLEGKLLLVFSKFHGREHQYVKKLTLRRKRACWA